VRPVQCLLIACGAAVIALAVSLIRIFASRDEDNRLDDIDDEYRKRLETTLPPHRKYHVWLQGRSSFVIYARWMCRKEGKLFFFGDAGHVIAWVAESILVHAERDLDFEVEG
jgi:hypothetical protein